MTMRPGQDSTLQTLARSWHTVTCIRAFSRLAQTAAAVPVVASGVRRSQCQEVVRWGAPEAGQETGKEGDRRGSRGPGKLRGGGPQERRHHI